MAHKLLVINIIIIITLKKELQITIKKSRCLDIYINKIVTVIEKDEQHFQFHALC